jgi:dTDP-4-dehydrorhamnose reductase
LRILLTGRNGQVGWELQKTLAPLGTLIATDRTTLDLADPDSIRRVVREAKPEVIVNAAAYTAVDRAESEPDLAAKVNARGPGILAEEAKRSGALLVHYSTDYVFDGTKESPYLEDDPANPLSVYGRTKRNGELAIVESGCRYLLLRTSWVYGPRGRNFLLAILRKAQAGEALRVVSDQVGVPTTSAFLAEMSSRALRAGGELEGIYHLVPGGQTTWYGFARAIVEGVEPKVQITPIATADYPVAARRPANSLLDNSKFRKRFSVDLPEWPAGLASCLRTYGETA